VTSTLLKAGCTVNLHIFTIHKDKWYNFKILIYLNKNKIGKERQKVRIKSNKSQSETHKETEEPITPKLR
jgi:hypothetical protein